MRNTRKICMISTVLFSLFLTNYIMNAQAGGSAVPFLLISPDARSSGMGEVGTAIADDINAVFWNTAGLAFHDSVEVSEDEYVPYRQVSLTYSRWLPQFNADLFYCYGTIGQYFSELDGTLALNFVLMNLGEFTKTFENGVAAGKFLSNEFAISGSYATIVAQDFGIGFTLRYIRSNLAPATAQTQGEAGVGNSVSFDLSFLWKPQDLNILGLDIKDRLSLGLNLQNVGPKMTYRKESDPLPTQLRIGAAFNVLKDEFNDWKFAVDFAKLLVKRDSVSADPLPKSLITGWQNPGVEFSIGSEYWYEHIVALRAGYFTEPSLLGNRRYWNFGAGVRYDIFELDFSFINTIEQNHPLANTMRFSALIDWK